MPSEKQNNVDAARERAISMSEVRTPPLSLTRTAGAPLYDSAKPSFDHRTDIDDAGFPTKPQQQPYYRTDPAPAPLLLDDDNHYEPEPFQAIKNVFLDQDNEDSGGDKFDRRPKRKLLSDVKGQRSFDSARATPPADSDLFDMKF